MSRYTRELAVAAALALLLAVLAVAAPAFYTGDKLRSILVTSAPVLVAAVGMTLVILTRQIDISIGSQYSVCGIVAGLLAAAGWPMPLVGVATVVLGGMLGAVNGGLVAGLGLPSIVVSLAMMAILREGLRWAREGEFVTNLPAGFQWFGLGQDAGQWTLIAIAVVVALLAAWCLRYLAAGRAVYATGSDPQAAFLAGLQPRAVTFCVFVLLGAFIGLAALLGAVQFPHCDPTAGEGLELRVIAAVVVGGVAISGGRGTLVGPLLGVLLLATIGPALQFLKFEAHWEQAAQGAIILLAVASDRLAAQRRSHA
jgi:ribose/xylose/arabinose/galactoside ABC-type transport system permease subunit